MTQMIGNEFLSLKNLIVFTTMPKLKKFPILKVKCRCSRKLHQMNLYFASQEENGNKVIHAML